MERSVSLPSVTFQTAGARPTRLGLGGEGILRTFGRDDEASSTIEAALAAGVTYFESARAYSGSEGYYGRTLGSRREGVFLATKAHDRTRNGARAMLETSLRTLQTGHLDLWQFHDIREWDEVDDLDHPANAYAEFVDAKQRGDVRAIGVTGHHAPEVLRAALEKVRFDAVLLPINPAEGALPDGFVRSVVPAARARNMFVVGMKVFARGLLLDGSPQAFSNAELLRYALSCDVDAVVVGCDDPQQVRANAQAVADFVPMDEAQRAALEARVAPIAGRLAYYRKTALA